MTTAAPATEPSTPSATPSPTRFDSLGADRPTRASWALFALAVGGFAIGTTEFASMGLLPQIAGGVGVTIPTAGQLISAYALGVVIGAPLIAAVAARVPRRQLLLVLMLVFLIGNAASAFATSFGFLLVARFVSGLPHGAYFGVASVVAAALVPANRRASAVARVMLGLTISNIVGVPMATWAGQHLGWPALYIAVAVLAFCCLVAVSTWVPPVRIGDGSASVRSELSALARPQVWFALVTGMVSFGGMFATYSYIAPTVMTLAGLSENGVVWILASFGVGSTVGALLGGRLADRALVPALLGGLVAIGVVLAAFGFLATTPGRRLRRRLPPRRLGQLHDARAADPPDGRRGRRPVARRRADALHPQRRERRRRLARRCRARRGLLVRVAEPGLRRAPGAGPRHLRRRARGPAAPIFCLRFAPARLTL